MTKAIGISMMDMLTTFNMSVGYYAFVAKRDIERTVTIGTRLGYPSMPLGKVIEGPRGVNFLPGNLWLNPKS